MPSTGFFERVYDIVARIPRGRVVTYGQIAFLVGNPRAARTVGWAVHDSPPERDLPCHRVVRKSGRLPPDHVFGGAGVQRRLLEKEGVTFLGDGRVDLARHLWEVAPESIRQLLP
jgi:methylated-DNA-protein-cysteine methyltransferase-like protein